MRQPRSCTRLSRALPMPHSLMGQRRPLSFFPALVRTTTSNIQLLLWSRTELPPFRFGSVENEFFVLGVRLEGLDHLVAALDLLLVDLGLGVEHRRGDEDHQLRAVVVEIGRAEQGAENGDVAQERDLLDALAGVA